MVDQHASRPLLSFPEARKRKVSSTHISVLPNTGNSQDSLNNDITYSSIKKRRQTRKHPLISPALPSTTNQFPIHAPPATPYQKWTPKDDKLTIPKSYINTTPKGDNGMGFKLQIASYNNEKDTNIELDNPLVNPGFRLSPGYYDPVSFIEPEMPSGQSFDLPDTTAIANHSNIYYPILLSLHAPKQSAITSCLTPGCDNAKGPYYNCNDCFDSNSYCQQCIKTRHVHLPFHRIHMWDDSIGCYSQISLADLGLVSRLTHEDGATCTSCDTIRQLQVLHVNGMHNLSYYQCTCLWTLKKQSTAQPTQLLANKLFPATPSAPMTAFTFDLLDLFDTLNLATFANIKQFCDAIISLTPRDLKYFGEIPGRLRSNFHYSVRLWRLFKTMMMHGYQQYSDLLRSSIIRGCPACPQPKVNIPDNWHKHPHKKLLYSLCLSGDGNFHLQSRMLVKDIVQDPSCFGDSGFFTPYETYQKYIAADRAVENSKKGENCNGKAGVPVRDRIASNMKTAGVFAWQCRHGLFKAHGVADLPKGERFDIVDIPLLKIINDTWENGLEDVFVIYDSACRYKVKFHTRCKRNPHTPLDRKYWHRITPESSFLKWFVNAFHQYSHNPECADDHSLRNSSDIGMVTGEEIETAWASLNHLQYSIREMDGGARIDMITAHMLAINEEKIKKMGERLLNRLLEAEQQYQVMKEEFSELEAGFEEASPGTTRKYRELYEQRGGEQFRPDPTKVKYPTKNETLAKLRAEEQRIFSSSIRSIVLLAGQGLELEEKWYVFITLDSLYLSINRASLDANKKKNQAWFKREQSLLTETLKHYNEVSDAFPLIAKGEEDSRHVALPSAYSVAQSTDTMYARFFSAELDLRVGMGHDILQEIRSNAGVINYYSQKQKREARGQQELKSVIQSQKRVSSKKSRFIQKYIDNWKRIQTLLNYATLSDKEKVLCLKGLKALSRTEDISFFAEVDNPASGVSKKTGKRISWIWRVSMLEQPGDECTQSLLELESEWEREARRLLWLQAFTRLERWKEELLLVKEEMQRLAEWHRYYIKTESQKLDFCIDQNGNRSAQGYRALLCENIKHLKLAYEDLPRAIKAYNNMQPSCNPE